MHMNMYACKFMCQMGGGGSKLFGGQSNLDPSWGGGDKTCSCVSWIFASVPLYCMSKVQWMSPSSTGTSNSLFVSRIDISTTLQVL